MPSGARFREQRQALFRLQGGCCYWCARPCVEMPRGTQHLPDHAATLDHVDSRLSRERGKHPGEFRRVMACRKCNQERAEVEMSKVVAVARISLNDDSPATYKLGAVLGPLIGRKQRRRMFGQKGVRG